MIIFVKMKRTLFVLAGIGLLCLLLVVRLFFRQHDGFDSEREWFVKNVRYEFSARVDSVKMLNENTGRLYCRVTSGMPQSHREDSLKQYFKEHDMLYLIFHQSRDSIVFLIPENAQQIEKGDSVHVSSSGNDIRFFRQGKQINNTTLTQTLTGYGRPFFLKKKSN